MTDSAAPQLSEDEKTNLYHLVSKEMESNKFEPAVLSRAQIESGPDQEQVKRAYAKLRYEQLVRRLMDRRSAELVNATAAQDRPTSAAFTPRASVLPDGTSPPTATANTPAAVTQAMAPGAATSSHSMDDARFFSPVAAALWSMLLGGGFGCYILWRNWKAAGLPAKAEEVMVLGILYVLAIVALPAVLVHMELQSYATLIWISAYALWCVAAVAPQQEYLKKSFGAKYQRQLISSWILPMIGGFVFLFAVGVSMPMIALFMKSFIRGVTGS